MHSSVTPAVHLCCSGAPGRGSAVYSERQTWAPRVCPELPWGAPVPLCPCGAFGERRSRAGFAGQSAAVPGVAGRGRRPAGFGPLRAFLGSTGAAEPLRERESSVCPKCCASALTARVCCTPERVTNSIEPHVKSGFNN